MKILVIDDHWAIRAGVRQILKKLEDDVRVIEASSFKEGMEITDRQDDLDLILLDLLMPDMERFSGLESLHRKMPGTPIVIMTAVEERKSVLRTIELGAAGYIPKTATSDEMLEALRLVLAGGVAVPRALLERETPVSSPFGGSLGEAEDLHSLVESLSARQKEVLKLLSQGKSNSDIAEQLDLAKNTVKVHVSTILKTLKLSNRTQAALVSRSHFGAETSDAA